jgi:hypothetical protein
MKKIFMAACNLQFIAGLRFIPRLARVVGHGSQENGL